jgi:hypothetical protein
MYGAVADTGKTQVREPQGAPFDNIHQVCPGIFILSRSKVMMKMLDKANANLQSYQITVIHDFECDNYLSPAGGEVKNEYSCTATPHLCLLWQVM